MIIETNNLRIQPLSHQQLLFYVKNDLSLERDLAVAEIERTITKKVETVLSKFIIPTVAQNPQTALFYTFWSIVHKASNTLVADLCFKGPPDENGEIEIGYGTYDSFKNRGIMTEAVKAIVAWAFSQNGVTAVVAETDPLNLASHRVLEKNGFQMGFLVDNNIGWTLPKP